MENQTDLYYIQRGQRTLQDVRMPHRAAVYVQKLNVDRKLGVVPTFYQASHLILAPLYTRFIF